MTHVDMSWVHDTATRLAVVKGEGVPEGIAYPFPSSLSMRDQPAYQEWQAKALEAGRASWRIIGGQAAWVIQRYATQTIHVMRTEPRGYGRKRKLYRQTTECGQVHAGLSLPEKPNGRLSDVSCLPCRSVVRERFENEVRYGTSDTADAVLAEYDALLNEEWWRVQAEWHKADPVPMPRGYIYE